MMDASCSWSDGALGEEIELAERYLLSGMYPQAVDLSSTILRKIGTTLPAIRTQIFSNEELKEMVEASGMVLLQAYSEMDRLGSLFDVLGSHFGGLESVPNFLFLPGVCLHLQAGLVYPAQLALEAYLSGWSIGEEYCTKPYQILTAYAYGDLSEIYAVHVLAKARENPSLAIEWIKQTNLAESRKQNILDKLKAAVGRKVENAIGNPVLVSTDDSDSQSKRQPIIPKPKPLQITCCLRILLKFLEVALMHLRSSKSTMRIAGGTLTMILVYAFVRQRKPMRRYLGSGLKRIGGVLAEFWDVAFRVQVNPLAAVQPLSRH